MECGDASPLFPRRARSAVLPSPDSDVPNLSKTNLASSWNFGPSDQDCVSVQHIVNTLCSKWGCGANLNIDNAPHQHEAQFLKLDCSKAKTVLNWLPTWHVDKALDMIVEWTKAYQRKADLRAMCIQQIEEYEAEAHKR